MYTTSQQAEKVAQIKANKLQINYVVFKEKDCEAYYDEKLVIWNRYKNSDWKNCILVKIINPQK